MSTIIGMGFTLLYFGAAIGTWIFVMYMLWNMMNSLKEISHGIRTIAHNMPSKTDPPSKETWK